MRRNNEQKFPIVGEVAGKLQSIDDTRMPTRRPRYISSQYKKWRTQRIIPNNAVQEFDSSNQPTLQFIVSGEDIQQQSPIESYVEFSLDLQGDASTQIHGKLSDRDAATDVDWKTLSGITETYDNCVSGKVTAAKTISYVYTRNTACLFDRIEIKDFKGNTIVDEVRDCGLLMTAMLNGQSEEFYDTSNGLELSDKYLATVHTFQNDSTLHEDTKVDPTHPEYFPSESHRVPYFERNPFDSKQVSAIPALLAGGAYGASDLKVRDDSTVVFPEVARGLQLMKNSVKGGYRFRLLMPSDLFSTDEFLNLEYNKFMVSLPLNSYSKAFTDLFATYNATHSSWNDSVALPATPRKSNFNKFILSNCIFVIKKYEMNEQQMQELTEAYNTTGYEIPFTRYLSCDVINVPVFTNVINWSYSNPDVQDLQQLLFIIRRESDCLDNSRLSKYEFCMGQSWDHNAIATYDGIEQLEITHKGNKMICDDLQSLEIGPYKTQLLKDQLVGCFGQENNTAVLQQLYDGVNPVTKIFNGDNTGFLIALDFRSMKGIVEKSGISLVGHPLQIIFKFRNHLVPLRINAYACCSAVLFAKAGQTQECRL